MAGSLLVRSTLERIGEWQSAVGLADSTASQRLFRDQKRLGIARKTGRMSPQMMDRALAFMAANPAEAYREKNRRRGRPGLTKPNVEE